MLSSTMHGITKPSTTIEMMTFHRSEKVKAWPWPVQLNQLSASYETVSSENELKPKGEDQKPSTAIHARQCQSRAASTKQIEIPL